MTRMLPAFALIALLVLASRSATADPYVEVGDAGQLPGTAQATSTLESLMSISGTLSSSNADMFKIQIVDFASFSATNVSAFDGQLALFDENGFGVYANDDTGGAATGGMLPAGNINGPASNGIYYVAVSPFNHDPVSPGSRIFPNRTFHPDSENVDGPTGPGGTQAITGWIDPSFQSGNYAITLTGAAGSEFTASEPPPNIPIEPVSGGIDDANPYTAEAANGVLEVIVRLHVNDMTTLGIDPGQEAAWIAEIEGKWNGNGGDPKQAVIDGNVYEIIVDVRFLGDPSADGTYSDPDSSFVIPASLVTEINVFDDLPSAPGGNANTTNWVLHFLKADLDGAPLMAAHEFGHILGVDDDKNIAAFAADTTGLMGSVTGSALMYARYYEPWVAVFAGTGAVTSVLGELQGAPVQGDPDDPLINNENSERTSELQVIPVPEPLAFGLLALGVIALGARRRYRKRR